MAVWWVVGTLGGLVAEAVLIIALGRRATSRWERSLDDRTSSAEESTARSYGNRVGLDWGHVVDARSRGTIATPRVQGASASP